MLFDDFDAPTVKRGPDLLEFQSTELGWKCKTIIIAAHLYYDRAFSLITDTEYDRTSAEVAAAWDRLHPQWKWSFVSAEHVAATGCGLRMSSLQCAAADVTFKRKRGTAMPYRFADNVEGVSPFGYQYAVIKG